MAGGLGSRFWPVSNTDSPKQFIDVLGTGKTMLQLTFERFERLCRRDRIIIVTGEQYVRQVHEQVPSLLPYQVLSEPLRRNTAPCIAYAASVIAQMDPTATIIVSPSDHAVFNAERFATDIRQAVDTVQEHDWIITLGAQPVRPDPSYGYIQFRKPSDPSVEDNLFEVVTFTEKPPVEMARQFIASGEFFWNAGIFVWTLKVLRQAYQSFLPSVYESFATLGLCTPREELERVYSTCESVSVDHGIMERASNVHVMAASFGWSDVETWDSLYSVSRHDENGNAIIGGQSLNGANVFAYNTRNTIVVMPHNPAKTVVLEGLDGYIVAANEDTFMVCRRSSEEMVFRFASDVEMEQLLFAKVK